MKTSQKLQFISLFMLVVVGLLFSTQAIADVHGGLRSFQTQQADPADGWGDTAHGGDFGTQPIRVLIYNAPPSTEIHIFIITPDLCELQITMTDETGSAVADFNVPAGTPFPEGESYVFGSGGGSAAITEFSGYMPTIISDNWIRHE